MLKPYQIFCNPFFGNLINKIFSGSIPNLRYLDQRYYMPLQHTLPQVIASLFWGFYENAELHIIKKFLSGYFPVIEIGGSMGVVSSSVVRKLGKEKKLIIVEVNPNLTPVIQKNIEKTGVSNPAVDILNKAVHYSSPQVVFEINQNSTAGSEVFDISTYSGMKNKEVRIIDATSLSELRKDFDIDIFSLVCDIEGNEYEIFRNELPLLGMKCAEIVIELHNMRINEDYTSTIPQLLQTLKHGGFKELYKKGNVYYLRNTNLLHLFQH